MYLPGAIVDLLRELQREVRWFERRLLPSPINDDLRDFRALLEKHIATQKRPGPCRHRVPVTGGPYLYPHSKYQTCPDCGEEGIVREEE